MRRPPGRLARKHPGGLSRDLSWMCSITRIATPADDSSALREGRLSLCSGQQVMQRAGRDFLFRGGCRRCVAQRRARSLRVQRRLYESPLLDIDDCALNELFAACSDRLCAPELREVARCGPEVRSPQGSQRSECDRRRWTRSVWGDEPWCWTCASVRKVRRSHQSLPRVPPLHVAAPIRHAMRTQSVQRTGTAGI